MQPLLEEAAKIRGVIVDLKVQLRELKRSYAAKEKIDAIETAIAEKTPDWAGRPTTVPYAVFGDPQSLNLYGYVRNDPVTLADADGHNWIKDLFGLGSPDPDQYVGLPTCTAPVVEGKQKEKPKPPESYKSKALKWVGQHPKTVKTVFVSVQVVTALSGVLDEGASEALLPEEEVVETEVEAAAEKAVADEAETATTEEATAEGTKAAEAGGEAGGTVLQSGGKTLSSSASKSLNKTFGENLERREWGRALENLKKGNQIPNDVHGELMSNGDFVVDGKVVGQYWRIHPG